MDFPLSNAALGAAQPLQQLTTTYLFAAITIAFLATPPARATDPSADASVAPGVVTLLRVKLARGENLNTLAKRYGTTARAIATANGLTNPDRVFAGQILSIPTGLEAAAQAPTTRMGPRPLASELGEPTGALPPKRAEAPGVVTAFPALARAPAVQGTLVIRPARLERRPRVEAARNERFGVTGEASHSLRRGALDVVAPLRDP